MAPRNPSQQKSSGSQILLQRYITPLTFECEDNQATTAFKVKSSPPDYLEVLAGKVEVTPQREGYQLITLKFQETEIPGCPFVRLFVTPQDAESVEKC